MYTKYGWGLAFQMQLVYYSHPSATASRDNGKECCYVTVQQYINCPHHQCRQSQTQKTIRSKIETNKTKCSYPSWGIAWKSHTTYWEIQILAIWIWIQNISAPHGKQNTLRKLTFIFLSHALVSVPQNHPFPILQQEREDQVIMNNILCRSSH